LRVLWEQGPCSVRRIVENYEEAGTPTQAATVQKLLERLEAKGWVDRDRSEAVQRFRATASRDELIGRRLQGIAEELCEGSLTPLISHLVKRDRLSASDRKRLRDLVEELDAESSNKHSKRS
ncbi:MAG: BlaI/MecI/CopY family transcriptional regulator, partial [Planctomycetes bacterium]|nr:BlaI/MecI/CopY family transcriptional regulator [Planctomycetota bacterium]